MMNGARVLEKILRLTYLTAPSSDDPSLMTASWFFLFLKVRAAIAAAAAA